MSFILISFVFGHPLCTCREAVEQDDVNKLSVLLRGHTPLLKTLCNILPHLEIPVRKKKGSVLFQIKPYSGCYHCRPLPFKLI